MLGVQGSGFQRLGFEDLSLGLGLIGLIGFRGSGVQGFGL